MLSTSKGVTKIQNLSTLKYRGAKTRRCAEKLDTVFANAAQSLFENHRISAVGLIGKKTRLIRLFDQDLKVVVSVSLHNPLVAHLLYLKQNFPIYLVSI